MKVPLTRPVLIECLRILGQTYPKPLPPLNWCFLHDLFHKDELIKNRCINLACKQILLSGSALRFVENYVTTFEPSAGKVRPINRTLRPHSLKYFLPELGNRDFILKSELFMQSHRSESTTTDGYEFVTSRVRIGYTAERRRNFVAAIADRH